MRTPVLLPEAFTVRLEMISDWHVGAGIGRSGDVDRLVARDMEGLPFVPAKTLTGIWRDACELVAAALDNGQQGVWSAWVACLFGSQPALADRPEAAAPLPAALSVRAARLPASLRAALAVAAGPLREAVTFVKPGIRIDEQSGTVFADHFRLDELARGGAVLTAPCTLTLPLDGGGAAAEARAAASALLVAGSRLVERLGGGRRRGSGRCRLVVADQEDVGAVTAWLRAVRDQPPAPPQRRLDPARPPRPAPATALAASVTPAEPVEDAGGWVEVPLLVTVTAPLAVPRRVTGNVAETLDYLPGTHLLPTVAAALERLGVDATAAIGRGDLRVLPAFVEVAEERGRPVPLALFATKATEPFAATGTVANRLCEPEHDDLQPRVQVRRGYLTTAADGRLPAYGTVPTVVLTHNTVFDPEQRPTEQVGGVYTYEAIRPGCRLRGALRLRAELHQALLDREASWWQQLAGAVRLGRSKKDDFGLVQLEVQPPRRLAPRVVAPADRRLVVWLLSDALLRDRRLRPDPTVDGLARAVGEALGVTLRPVDGGVFVRQSRLDTWQVRWQRPRPSLIGLAAGSCVAFEVTSDTPDPGRIAALALEGVGERRAEGYGQLCVNDPLLLGPLAALPAPSHRASSANGEVSATATGSDSDGQTDPGSGQPRHPPRVARTDPAFDYARVIERAAWRSLIATRALARGADPAFRKGKLAFDAAQALPPTSQLSGLRAAARQLDVPGPDSWAARWLHDLESVEGRRDRWPNAARAAIRRLLEEPDTVWEWLGDGEDVWPVLTEGGEEALRAELWREAVRTLLDVAAHAHQRALEGLTNDAAATPHESGQATEAGAQGRRKGGA
jgi:CRISPR-associated protein Csx10